MVGTTTATAVVTGANSFIATEIISQLLHKGYAVRATVRDVRDPSKTEPLRKLAAAFSGELSFYEAELGVPGAFHSAVKGAHYVYHCAAHLDDNAYTGGVEGKRLLIDKALESQLDIIKAAAASRDTVRKMVITSSMAAVKPFHAYRLKKPWNEEDWIELTDEQLEHNSYAYLKTLTEKRSFELAEELGIDLSSIVPAFVVGPIISEQLGFSPYAIKKFMEDGQSDSIMWLATAVDVRDVARAHILAAEKTGPGSRYLVARSHPLHPGDLVDSIRTSLPGYRIDDQDNAKQGFYDPTFQIFNTSKVQEELGLHLTDLHESFHDMVFSMISKGVLNLKPIEEICA